MIRLTGALLLIAATSGRAADAFYIGTWKIVSATVAPWWNEPQKPDPAEMQGLVGKTVNVAAHAIRGPRQVACSGPRYRGSRWKTLETGCGNEVDYHFIDRATAAFGLNNCIYILKKQPLEDFSLRG